MHLTALVSVSVSLSYGLINISDRKKHIVVDEFTARTLPWSGVKTKVPHVSSKSRLVVCNFMACWTSMWQSDKSYRVLLYLVFRWLVYRTACDSARSRSKNRYGTVWRHHPRRRRPTSSSSRRRSIAQIQQLPRLSLWHRPMSGTSSSTASDPSTSTRAG